MVFININYLIQIYFYLYHFFCILNCNWKKNKLQLVVSSIKNIFNLPSCLFTLLSMKHVHKLLHTFHRWDLDVERKKEEGSTQGCQLGF